MREVHACKHNQTSRQAYTGALGFAVLLAGLLSSGPMG